jgi:hypothetical protein
MRHSPIAPYVISPPALPDHPVLILASCSCGDEDCMMTAAVYADLFFTPAGDQGARS